MWVEIESYYNTASQVPRPDRKTSVEGSLISPYSKTQKIIIQKLVRDLCHSHFRGYSNLSDLPREELLKLPGFTHASVLLRRGKPRCMALEVFKHETGLLPRSLGRGSG